MKVLMVVLCELILLITTFSTVTESAGHSVTVKLNKNATLSCSERCSGLVRWTVFSKPKDSLAECDQTSCRSVKEGYQMIHHQYLNGNFSLTITDADFSKRNLYSCDCDGKDLCDVRLLIEPLNTTVQIQTGESLVLEVDIPEEVVVLYNSTDPAGASSGQICTVAVHSQCEPEYTQRVSAAVTLRRVTPSDSGVYTIKDKLNEEVIHTYTVSGDGSEAHRQIHKPRLARHAGCPLCVCKDHGAALPGWVVPVLAVLAVLLVVSVGMNVWLKSENQKLRKEPRSKEDTHHIQNGVQMIELDHNGAGEQQRLT